MHKFGYTSSKTIISKVERDFKPNSSTWLVDALEWLGEAISRIGCFNQYQRVTLTKSVVDGKLRMPCSIDNFIAIYYEGKRLSLNPRVTRSTDISKLTTQPHPSHYYNYNGTYFTFTFETGNVDILYNGIPMDCGWPMIPDNGEYKEALMFYIMNRMIMGGYIHPIFDWKQTIDYFEHYAQRARNEVDELKLSDLDSFMEEWTSVFCGVDILDRIHGNTKYSGSTGVDLTDNPFTL